MRPGLLRSMRGWTMRKLPLMITCVQLDAFIVDYLEGTLPRRQRLIFEMHLLVCPECRAYLRAYRNAIALGQAALLDPALEDVPEELVQAIVAARRGDE